MNFNRQKLEALERRAVRLMAVAKGAGDRYERARDKRRQAQDEFERQRTGRKRVQVGGVPRRYERLLREAVAEFERATAERDEATLMRDESGSLVDSCHRFLRDELGLDFGKQEYEPGDTEVIYTESEIAERKRRGLSTRHMSAYISGVGVQR